MSAPTLTRAPAITRTLGQSGRSYLVERILQDSLFRYGRAYLARSGDQKFILKSVSPHDFKYFKKMYGDLQSSPYVRVAEDTNPEEFVFVYKYLRDHLLSFVQKDVPLTLTKRILRDSLRGIATLHENGIVHTDIKPNNIMIEWKDQDGTLEVEQVQIADIERAAYVPDHSSITRDLFGHWTWRSPEAHTSREVNKPTDIFSFGLVCIYALTKSSILSVDEDKIPYGVKIAGLAFRRQIAFFADKEGLEGLTKYVHGNLWARILGVVVADVYKTESLKPFSTWPDIDPDFRDLVGRMTNFDPTRRITAKEALEHKWFSDVP